MSPADPPAATGDDASDIEDGFDEFVPPGVVHFEKAFFIGRGRGPMLEQGFAGLRLRLPVPDPLHPCVRVEEKFPRRARGRGGRLSIDEPHAQSMGFDVDAEPRRIVLKWERRAAWFESHPGEGHRGSELRQEGEQVLGGRLQGVAAR